MCQIISVAAIQHEAFELLEETNLDRLVTHTYATECEQIWERDAEDELDLELLEAA